MKLFDPTRGACYTAPRKAKNSMKRDLKKTIGKVKAAQGKLRSFLKNPKWIDEARAYAEKRGKEVRALISSDVDRKSVV